MMFFLETKLISILGVMALKKLKSMRDKLQRKKYMGICRWELSPMRVIKPRFPTTVST